MLGEQQTSGLSVLTIEDIFTFIQNETNKVYDIKISYVEIYNETIKDLLTQSTNYLELRDDPK